MRSKPDRLPARVYCTGQHKEMLSTVFDDFDFQPDVTLDVMKAGQTLGALTAKILVELESCFANERPAGILVQGDTTSALCGALAGFYMGVPVYHVEAGLRTGTIESPFPEEFNRVTISKIARLHFAPTLSAADNLLAEKVDQKSIIVTGNTVVDAIELLRQKGLKPDDSCYTQRLQQALDEKRIILVTAHRRENHSSGIVEICRAILEIANVFPALDIVFPVHLNPKVTETVQTILGGRSDNINLMPPVSFRQMLYFQSRSRLLITDSGGLQEEAPAFGIPTLVTRASTERLEGLLAGFSEVVGCNASLIVERATSYLGNPVLQKKLLATQNPYGDGKASERIIAAISNTVVTRSERPTSAKSQ